MINQQLPQGLALPVKEPYPAIIHNLIQLLGLSILFRHRYPVAFTILSVHGFCHLVAPVE